MAHREGYLLRHFLNGNINEENETFFDSEEDANNAKNEIADLFANDCMHFEQYPDEIHAVKEPKSVMVDCKYVLQFPKDFKKRDCCNSVTISFSDLKNFKFSEEVIFSVLYCPMLGFDCSYEELMKFLDPKTKKELVKKKIVDYINIKKLF